jgi:hypothetical protein
VTTPAEKLALEIGMWLHFHANEAIPWDLIDHGFDIAVLEQAQDLVLRQMDEGSDVGPTVLQTILGRLQFLRSAL